MQGSDDLYSQFLKNMLIFLWQSKKILPPLLSHLYLKALRCCVGIFAHL
jgi:hypothetical protein